MFGDSSAAGINGEYSSAEISFMRSVARLLAVVCTLSGCESPESASPGDPRQFFHGKTMTYVVASEPGGGYDAYGRLVSKYLGKHLGVARVVVKNVPGGGHIVGANELYRARPDGLTVGIFNPGLVYAVLVGQPGLVADLARMSWVGSAGGDDRVLVVSTRLPFRTLDDIRAAGRPLVVGESGVGSTGYTDSRLLASALGLKTKAVLGLAQRGAELAMMRGEIDATFGAASSVRAFVRNGYARSVARVGSHTADPLDGPDVSPLVTSTEGREILALVGTIAHLGRWTAGPPGIPAERLEILRRAYDAALADSELSAAARQMDLPITPMRGQDLGDHVRTALEPPDHVRDLVRRIAAPERREDR